MPRKKTTRSSRKSTSTKQTQAKQADMTSSATPRVLYRSVRNRVIGGVAGGLGEYFYIDPTIIRIIFILLTIFGGSGILLYIVLWIILPSQDSVVDTPRETMKNNVKEMRESMRDFTTQRQMYLRNTRFVAGILILILGLLFLASNFGLFYGFTIGSLWPLILVAIGIAILARK